MEASPLPLKEGWNFGIFAKKPGRHFIDTVLQEVSQNVAIVWGYDNQAKTWLKWKPSASGSSLTALEPGKGYWMYMNSGTTLVVAGIDILPDVYLYAGWNLIGYSGQTARMQRIA